MLIIIILFVIKNNDLSVLKNSFNNSFNYQFKGFILKMKIHVLII